MHEDGVKGGVLHLLAAMEECQPTHTIASPVLLLHTLFIEPEALCDSPAFSISDGAS